MILKKIYFIVLFGCSTFLFGQEICDNGIDDDGDGLIDLNDNDCKCIVKDYITDPYFADTTRCPAGEDITTSGHYEALRDWDWSGLSPEFHHPCEDGDPAPTGGNIRMLTNNSNPEDPPKNFEYTKTCLAQPLLAGITYTFEFTAKTDKLPADFILIGNDDCSKITFGPRCIPDMVWMNPINLEWDVLATVAATGPVNQYNTYSVDFTPTRDIPVVSIGGGCNTTKRTVLFFDYANIILDPIEITSISETGDACDGDLSLSASATPIGGNWQWYLEGAALAGETNTNIDISGGGYGTGSYTARYTLGSQCDTMTANATDNGTIDFTTNILNIGCAGGCTGGISFTGVSGGTPPYTYSVDNGTTFVSTPDFTGLCAGTYDLLIEDAGNCDGTASLDITALEPLSVVAMSDQTICEGNATAISATGKGGSTPYSFSWSDGIVNLNGQDQLVSPSTTTDYTITLTDDCGAIAEDDVAITVELVPFVEFSGVDLSGCAPVTASFSNDTDPSFGSDCFWDFGDGNNSTDCNPVHVYTVAGCYDVVLSVTTAAGCSSEITQIDQVCVYPVPKANFTYGPQPTDVLNSDIKFINGSKDADTYAWDLGDGKTSTQSNPTHIYDEVNPGSYQVTLTASNAECFDEITATVIINEAFSIFVPNTFTPNADGNNEIFIPSMSAVLNENYSFQIFDRWGNIIFKTNDKNQGWNGKINDENIAKPDVYIWKIGLENEIGEILEFSGHITLLN